MIPTDPTPRPAARRLPAGRLALAALAALLFTLPARSGTLDPAQIKETTFPNGLRLIVKEAHGTDLAAVQMWIRAGGFTEDERESGTAHVIEHLVFKGTESHAAGAIDDEIENLGGLLEASTEKDWTRFGCTVAGRYVGKVIPAMADVLRKPKFSAEDFEVEKPVILEEISDIATNPETSVMRGLYQAAFQHHPYGNDVRGTPQFLKKLTLDQVRAYYRRHYIPSNMTLVVVGDVDPAGVERVTRAAFQADQGGPPPAAPALPAEEKACAQPRRIQVRAPFSNGYVGIAFPAPSVKEDPDAYAMDVLLTLLEHGGNGRLPRILRQSAGVDASYETRRQPGLFTVIAATTPENVQNVEALIRKELDFVATHTVPGTELQFAKRELHGSFALENETYSEQASTLGYYDAIDRWQFATEYLSHVDKITAAQLQEVARKYLDPDHTITVLFSPRPTPMPRPQTGT